ncbi:MAG: enoyl-CoA hydratase/isomerase family protein [Sandaracinaceae bacterium]
MESRCIALPPQLDAAAIAELERRLREALASGAPVLVLEGVEPGVFCRGLDLTALASDADAREAVRGFARCLFALTEAARPTLAVVAGDALGGGLGLAAACDLTLATTEARVGLPEALFGILPAMIMPALLTRMTPQRARLLALSCVSEEATWARDAGLFDRVVGPERLDWARRRAERELARAAPGTPGRLRALIATVHGRPLAEGLEAATEIAAATFADADVRRAAQRFIEEGEAPWTA